MVEFLELTQLEFVAEKIEAEILQCKTKTFPIINLQLKSPLPGTTLAEY